MLNFQGGPAHCAIRSRMGRSRQEVLSGALSLGWKNPLLRNNLQRHLWEAKLAGEQSIQWVSLTGVANLSFPWYGSTSHVGLDSNDQPGSEHSIQLMFRDRCHDGPFPWMMVKNNLYGGAYRVSWGLRTYFTHNGTHCHPGIGLASSFGARREPAWAH